jgi:AcrR family transcriptional regulator
MTAQLKAEKRKQTKASIRLAALEEFACNGLLGTSTQAIAKRANISKPTLYYYISSKEELYQDILESILSKWGTLFFDIDNQDDPKRVISKYIETKIRHALDNPLECRFFSQEISRGAPVLRPHWEQSKQASLRASKVIESWVETGKIKPVDPMVFQMELWAVTQHYADYEAQSKFFLGLDPNMPLDADRLIKQAQILFLRGLGLPLDDA